MAYCCSRGLLFTSVVHQTHCCSVVTVNNNNIVQQLTFGCSSLHPCPLPLRCGVHRWRPGHQLRPEVDFFSVTWPRIFSRGRCHRAPSAAVGFYRCEARVGCWGRPPARWLCACGTVHVLYMLNVTYFVHINSMRCENDVPPSTFDPGNHPGTMGADADSEPARTVPVSLCASRDLFVRCEKNVNFAISDLGFPEELGHDLGRFGHLLSLYFARVSLFLRIDSMGRSRFFSISTYHL